MRHATTTKLLILFNYKNKLNVLNDPFVAGVLVETGRVFLQVQSNDFIIGVKSFPMITATSVINVAANVIVK